MKTKNTNSDKNQKNGLSNRPEQSSTENNRPKINFAARIANRSLNTESVLGILQKQAPAFYLDAEVVGKWIWLAFSEKQPATVTRVLAEFGFHWNNTRQVWQHPCGTALIERATYDPRKRYGSHFPARQTA